jgi:serine protease SohB
MMACVADQVIAAPFAVVGSIGVVAQIPNFHRLLKKHDVDFELVTAGDYKRTLTVFGENTEASRQKFRSEMEDTHKLFKEFVKEHRPQVNIDLVGTGEVWWGTRAAEVGLVDSIATSDEYLLLACKEADVLEVHFKERRRLQDRFLRAVEGSLDRTLSSWWARATSRYLT